MEKQNGKDNFNFPGVCKYGKAEHIIKNLKNVDLKCAHLREYNDPFEIAFHCNYFLNHIFQHYPELEILRNKIELEINNYCVTCFSRTPYEPLMWAHYADNHRGVCYCFSNNIFDYVLGQPSICVLKKDVVYSTTLPTIDFCPSSSSPDLLYIALLRIISTKSHHWAYEKEFRCFTNNMEIIKERDKKYFFSFSPKSLKYIILGMKFEENKKNVFEDVKNAVEEYNKKHDAEVKIKYALQGQLSYEIEVGEKKSRKRKSVAIQQIYDNTPISPEKIKDIQF